MNVLALVNNQLSGEIPSEIWTLTNLEVLNLPGNEFTGSIPPEIGNMTNLFHLDLSSNELSGEIPSEICNQGDETPNVSANQLCPPYPECLLGEEFIDSNENGVYDEGEEFVDSNENGVYDGYSVGEQDCQENSISEQPVPMTYNLSSPYPNPFNPSTTIQFSLPQSEMVSMKVYDLNGRLIETLLNDFYDMGKHTITWDGSSQSSGMYFVRLESGEYIQTRKVVLVQ